MAIESTGDNTLLVNIDANVTSQATTLNTISTNVNSTLTISQAIQTSAGKIVYAVFTASGTWTRPSGVTVIDALLVGGGGGGGPAIVSQRNGTTQGPAAAGGGGAGGEVKAVSNIYVGAYTSLTVTVGAGGSGGSVSGNGTSAATVTYQSNGSNTTLTNGTVTLAAAIGGSFGGGMNYLGATGVCNFSGTSPKANGRNLGGRGVAADLNTTQSSYATYLQGGTGAGGNSDGLTGLQDYEKFPTGNGWDGLGKLIIIPQSPITFVNSGSTSVYRAKIMYKNLLASNVGSGDYTTMKSQMYNTYLSNDSATWSSLAADDEAILNGQTYKSTDYYIGKTFLHSELMAAARGDFVAGLPMNANWSTSAYGDGKMSLSIPGPSTNGFGNGGWGGIVFNSSFSGSAHSTTVFPSPSSYIAFGASPAMYLHPGPYTSKTVPNRVEWNGSSTVSEAGTNGGANTGDGGNGAAAASYTSSTIVTAVKGGDGGSGICIISYSV